MQYRIEVKADETETYAKVDSGVITQVFHVAKTHREDLSVSTNMLDRFRALYPDSEFVPLVETDGEMPKIGWRYENETFIRDVRENEVYADGEPGVSYLYDKEKQEFVPITEENVANVENLLRNIVREELAKGKEDPGVRNP